MLATVLALALHFGKSPNDEILLHFFIAIFIQYKRVRVYCDFLTWKGNLPNTIYMLCYYIPTRFMYPFIFHGSAPQDNVIPGSFIFPKLPQNANKTSRQPVILCLQEQNWIRFFGNKKHFFFLSPWSSRISLTFFYIFGGWVKA